MIEISSRKVAQTERGLILDIGSLSVISNTSFIAEFSLRGPYMVDVTSSNYGAFNKSNSIGDEDHTHMRIKYQPILNKVAPLIYQI